MNHTSAFDLDLKYGQIGEESLSRILSDTKIEVKTERGIWKSTGNIAIEYMSRGKYSGIAVTKADWWCTILMDGDNIEHIILTPVKKLKEIFLREVKNGRIVEGGDYNTSKLVLVSIKSLFGR